MRYSRAKSLRGNGRCSPYADTRESQPRGGARISVATVVFLSPRRDFVVIFHVLPEASSKPRLHPRCLAFCLASPHRQFSGGPACTSPQSSAAPRRPAAAPHVASRCLESHCPTAFADICLDDAQCGVHGNLVSVIALNWLAAQHVHTGAKVRQRSRPRLGRSHDRIVRWPRILQASASKSTGRSDG